MHHFTSFFLNSKSNVLVKRLLFLLNAALAYNAVKYFDLKHPKKKRAG
jgi:hypothetical protein